MRRGSQMAGALRALSPTDFPGGGARIRQYGARNWKTIWAATRGPIDPQMRASGPSQGARRAARRSQYTPLAADGAPRVTRRLCGGAAREDSAQSRAEENKSRAAHLSSASPQPLRLLCARAQATGFLLHRRKFIRIDDELL